MIQAIDPPSWIIDSARAILDFAQLPPKWDSYGARPINRANIFAAIHLLQQIARPDTPQPSIVPTTTGGVQIEWHTRTTDLEVHLFSPDRFAVSFEDLSGNSAWEGEFDFDDLARVQEAVGALSV